MQRILTALLQLLPVKLVLAVYSTLLFPFLSQPPSIHHPSTTISVNRASTCFYLRASLTSLSARHVSCELDHFPHFVLSIFFCLLQLFKRYKNFFSTNGRSKPVNGSRLSKKIEERLEF